MKGSNTNTERTNAVIAYNLKKCRKNTGLTQAQVSEILNIERSTYTYYETGKTLPSINMLIRLAKLYNVSLADDLLENADLSIDMSEEKFNEFMRKETTSSDYTYAAQSLQEKEILTMMRSLTTQERKDFVEKAKKLIKEYIK